MPRLLQVFVAALAGLLIGAAAAWLLKPPATPVGAQHADFDELSRVAPQPHTVPDADQPSLPLRFEERRYPARTDERAGRPRVESHGDGLITGVVQWHDATPCVGLPLLAERDFLPWLQAYSDALVLPRHRWLARLQGIQSMIDEGTLSASSGPDGRFTLGGVGGGKYRLSSGDPQITFGSPLAEAGDDLTLIVRRPLTVRFRLIRDGAPIETARYLWIRSEGRPSPPGGRWQPEREYAVTPGTWTATVRDGPGSSHSDSDLWTAEREFEVPPEGLTEPVEIVLQAQPALVVSRTHESPYYENLSLYAFSSDTLPPGGLTAREAFIRARMSNRFYDPAVIRDLTPGRYTLFATVGMLDVLATMEVEYAGGLQEVEMELPPLQRDDHYMLRVYDPDDNPLSGAQVHVFMLRGAHDRNEPVVARGNGEYWIRRVEPSSFYYDGVSGHDIRIRVTHPAFGSRLTIAPLAQRDDVELRFKRKAKLIVHLDNLPANYSNLELVAYPTGDSEARAFELLSGWPINAMVRERMEFDLATGPVTVTLRAKPDRGRSSSSVLVRQRIELGEGTQEVRIRVPQPTSLRVHVPEHYELPSLTLYGLAGTWYAKPDDQRFCEYAGIPEGEYELRAAIGSMPVTLPAPGSVAFIPQPYNALRIRNLDGGGLFAEIGLRIGDFVRAVNGTELQGNGIEMTEKFQRAGDAGDVTLRVQRDGASFTVQAPGSRWKQLPTYMTEWAHAP